jgi:hypothetical protein
MSNQTLKSSIDIIGIFDSNTFEQLFINARPMKADIIENSKLMSHPVEDGTIVSDHKVIDPIKMTLPVILTSSDFKSIYSNIKQAFLDSTSLIIQTRTGSYPNMVISSMPHEETISIFNGITINLSLEQVKIIKPTTIINPKNAKNASTLNRGKQKNINTNDSLKSSVLQGLLS